MDSIRIRDRRTWFRYSELRGGDAISSLERFQGMSFTKAGEFLLDYHGGVRDCRAPPPPPAPKETVPFALPPPDPDDRRVTAYLDQTRCAAPQVIRDFIAAGLLCEEENCHNCVFLGKDGQGKAVYAAKRGTYDKGGASFRAGVPGSDKETGFRIPCGERSMQVFVFEAPIDLMSCCTLHRSVKDSAVALCGLYEGPLDSYLRDYPQLRRIDLCLDADGPGREAADHLNKKYTAQGYAVAVHTPPRGKDWNEFLQLRQKCRGQERRSFLQEEVENKTLTLAIDGSKLTGRMFKAAISKYLAHRREVKQRKQHRRDSPVIPPREADGEAAHRTGSGRVQH